MACKISLTLLDLTDHSVALPTHTILALPVAQVDLDIGDLWHQSRPLALVHLRWSFALGFRGQAGIGSRAHVKESNSTNT